MSEPISVDSNESDAPSGKSGSANRQSVYMRSSLKVILCLLPVWFIVSYGCGILFRDWLDAHAPKIGNASFGFWMAQQGSIICFVALLIVYAVWMNRLDRRYNDSEEK